MQRLFWQLVYSQPSSLALILMLSFVSQYYIYCGVFNIWSGLTRWGYDKFPKETPLVFYRAGQPILPPLELFEGLKVVLESMVSYIEREVPRKTLKFWRLQSPRHFYGGEWNQNGSCLLNEPLKEHEVIH
jgi:hypothetical protein